MNVDLSLPRVRDDATVAEEILAHVAAMRRDGSFEKGTSLCWNPADLELLAMFAIEAKNRLTATAEDSERLDWLEGELDREREANAQLDARDIDGPFPHSLFRRNVPITRAVIDAARGVESTRSGQRAKDGGAE